MRVITYILLTLSCLFALNVFIAASSPTYKTFLQEVKWNFSAWATTTVARDKRLTAADIRTDKLIRSLDRLGEKVDSLELQAPGKSDTLSGTLTDTGSLTGATSTGTTTGSGTTKTLPDLRLPGSLLARLMPQFIPTKTENTTLFEAKSFDTASYSTYFDKKRKLKVYVFDGSYPNIKAAFHLNEPEYVVNETDTFFTYTFFLNPIKRDANVRFITQVENKTIGIEIPKAAYPLIKKLLTK